MRVLKSDKFFHLTWLGCCSQLSRVSSQCTVTAKPHVIPYIGTLAHPPQLEFPHFMQCLISKRFLPESALYFRIMVRNRWYVVGSGLPTMLVELLTNFQVKWLFTPEILVWHESHKLISWHCIETNDLQRKKRRKLQNYRFDENTTF